MAFHSLAPELINHIYNLLPTISDVINLSLTCHRFNYLLRNSRKLTTLFVAADREFGPIHDIKMLLTYNATMPASLTRDPPISYALLRQAIVVGRIGKRFEELYPHIKWEQDFVKRRQLTAQECRLLRQAVYRYWLYSEAFHNSSHPRSHRLIPSVVEERCRLLRSWSTKSLVEIEDIRAMIEDILLFQICPTDGTVQHRLGLDALYTSQHFNHADGQSNSRLDHLQKLFHTTYDEANNRSANLPPFQARIAKMEGWGDEIARYYLVQSLLKLNPPQVLWLYDHAVYKWQVEDFVHDLGDDWFWNNGQTFLDTWIRVLHARGEDAECLRDKISDGQIGITKSSAEDDNDCWAIQ